MAGVLLGLARAAIAILQISWAEMQNLLQVVVNPPAQRFIHTGNAADNGACFPWSLVNFGEKVKVRELYVTWSLYNPLTVTFAAESSGEEGFAFGVNVKGINHGA